MDNDELIEYLRSMEERLQKQIVEARNEIIEELETALLEIGVYKKEIIEKIKSSAK